MVNKISRSDSASRLITRRQVMVGAAGLTFAFVGCRNAADTPSVDTAFSSKEMSPWVTIGADGTMQAPHSPAPQPYFVPVSFNPSRSTQSNGVSGGASVETGSSLSLKEMGIDSSTSKGNRDVRYYRLHWSLRLTNVSNSAEE